MDLQAAEYVIGAANAEDMGRVRAMLPRAFTGQRQPRIRVAKRLDNSRIIGVVAWWLRPKKKIFSAGRFFYSCCEFLANPRCWRYSGEGVDYRSA